jgi:glycosyltransferase involved in cell wall biosynthesis
MISILFCSRIKDNPASGLKALFDSIVATTSPTEREQIEVLIKFDEDDDQCPGEAFFAQYPFPVRTFVFARGEGRHGLHHAQEYLFAQRDPRSRFLLMTADDFVFNRAGWVREILAVRDELVILGFVRPNIEQVAAGWDQPENHPRWITSFGEWSPVISVRVIEICQNFGWQANVDSWLMALSLALYEMYRVVIWKPHAPFYRRTGGYGLGDTRTYNNMEVTCQKGPKNRYWFDLVRRQARNLYLNLEYGSDVRQRRWFYRVRAGWRKFWSQPLHHFPLRLWHRACRDASWLLSLTQRPAPERIVTPGMRPHQYTPGEYKAHKIWRSHGMYYAIPFALEAQMLGTLDYLCHPEVLSATNYPELQRQIDARPAPSYRWESTPFERPVAPTCVPEGEAIEFAGWLPAFHSFGNCGKHPQFRHTEHPPQGYRFHRSEPANLPPPRKAGSTEEAQPPKSWVDRTVAFCVAVVKTMLVPIQSVVAFCTCAPGVSWSARWRTLWAAWRLYRQMRAAGCPRGDALQFLHTRQWSSQFLLSENAQGPAFLTSIPYIVNQMPWVIEIEDITTLFFPYIHNGRTCEVNFQQQPVFSAIKALLEADECRAIVTHMRSTAEMLPRLFQSETIGRKVIYAPLGVALPPLVQRPVRGRDEPMELLFVNSWAQQGVCFGLRGGFDILEAFRILKVRYPRLRLTLRTTLPKLARHYQQILASDDVRIIDRVVSDEEMTQLHQQADIFLLPAARIHIVSLLGAMAHGLPVVVSDGWGFEEYVDDGRNGLVVRGRYGVTSWADQEAGVLREDYHTLYSPEPEIVAGLVEALTRLIEDPEYRARVGRNARQDVERLYTLERWNAALKEAFDRATGKPVELPGLPAPVPETTPELATSDT